MMKKRSAMVVCPGRGTYNREELGYFARYHPDQGDLLDRFDQERKRLGQPSLRELDGAECYSLAQHSRGDNASGLIYACAYADFFAIDTDHIDIVCVTGNSMGWYIALAGAGALDAMDGFRVVNTMGTLMHQSLIGGQVLYPVIDENWQEIPGQREKMRYLVHHIPNLHLSIQLGGMVVFAGDDAALSQLQRELPPIGDRFPMRLANHAGFHSPLQAPISDQGMAALPADLFNAPDKALIDGRGQAWGKMTTDRAALREYTLIHQVVSTYHFTASVINGLREFAPDIIIIPGPGNTLGGVVGQCLVMAGWQNMRSKGDFQRIQETEPILYAMGMDVQRREVVRAP